MKLCTVDRCSKKHASKGFCDTHYSRWRRNGDPTIYSRAERPRKPRTPATEPNPNTVSGLEGFMTARRKRIAQQNRTVTA